MQPDKVKHFVVGFLLGPLSLPAGALKEWWDRKGNGTYDPRDFWWTVAGGALSTLIVVAVL